MPVFVAAIVMLSGVLATVLASPASAYIVATEGFAFIDSEEGDAGGRGLQSTFTDSDSEIRSYPAALSPTPGNTALIQVDNDPQLSAVLSVQVSAASNDELTVGHYDVVDPYVGPRMYITVLGGYCPNQIGFFDIHDVAFTGDTATTLAASWQIACANGPNSPVFRGEIRFNSAVAPVGRSVEALPVDLTNVRVGTSATRTLTIENPMPTAMTITSLAFTGPDAGAFAVTSNTCPAVLAAGASCTASLRFSPTARRPADVDLVLTDSVAPAGRRLALSAVGVAPVLAVPAQVTFPHTEVGDENSGWLAVANTGDAALVVDRMVLDGPHFAEFDLELGTCPAGPFGTVTVLEPSTSCHLQLRFAPQAMGIRRAAVTIHSDGGTNTVPLSGTGTLGVLGAPNSVSFADAVVGRATAATLTVANTGNGSLQLQDVVRSGSDAGVFSVAGGTCYSNGRLLAVVPNSSCTIMFSFAPAATRPYAATVTVVSDRNDVDVALRGNGVAPPPSREGYWMIGSAGAVYAFGDAPYLGAATAPAGVDSVDLEPTPSGAGYWTVTALGQVSAFGDARYVGGWPALRPGETVTSLSRNRDGNGYWLFTSAGRVAAYGTAAHLGDMAAVRLNAPVLDSVGTPSGRGYYMVAADGGIFAFGDAQFHGSMGGVRLNQPVQSLVPDPDAAGYWLVAADGGIFAFAAPFHGSMGGMPMNRPVTGMVGSRSGAGYLMVAEDGGIFAFGDAAFRGSLGAQPPPIPIVAVAALP